MSEPFNPVLVAVNGTPLRPTAPPICPVCGEGPDKRTAAGGFGQPHEVCTQCGHEFKEDA